MINHSSDEMDLYFSLLHVCDALMPVSHEQIQILNRVLFSKIEELKSLHIKSSHQQAKSQFLKSVEMLDKIRYGTTEPAFVEAYLEKQQKVIQDQIFEAVRTLARLVYSLKELRGSRLEALLQQRLQELAANA